MGITGNNGRAVHMYMIGCYQPHTVAVNESVITKHE